MDIAQYHERNNPPRRIIVCKKCGDEKKLHAKNMCSACYMVARNKKRAEVNNLFI